MRTYTYDTIAALYASGGITDAQLDGTGAEPGSFNETHNLVTQLSWFTQEQANAIRAGAVDPETADMLAAINIYEGGE
ncbi:hypothetical protein DWV16_06635 [Anaerotruncus sp. AF02-27]|uniref:hypothetical protein n=1 Tax=Anaerotruncus TaxID=244127 RepID=UPI000E4C855E|nr:hypothetical protein [Anaerotruncus sp. AF02-27]RGX56018.1 hypothetical protein DWV16_06635 [Anaerotruncus sp. AF02-27]